MFILIKVLAFLYLIGRKYIFATKNSRKVSEKETLFS